jgi:hypothetical protein
MSARPEYLRQKQGNKLSTLTSHLKARLRRVFRQQQARTVVATGWHCLFGHGEAERPRGLVIDNQLELRGPHDRQIGWLVPSRLRSARPGRTVDITLR